jgi:hypothetical protein
MHQPVVNENAYDNAYTWPAPQQPYRPVPAWAPHPFQRRVMPPTRALRPIELGAVLAIVAAVDLTIWHDGIVGGGFGLAAIFVLLPLALLGAIHTRRVTPRLAAIAALLALVVVRCVYEPTNGTFMAGICLVGAFALALRRRSITVPEVFLSAVSGVGATISRIGATGRGIQVVASRSRLAKMNVLPIAIPAALVLVFLGVFALANPLVAHILGTVWNAITHLIALPSAGHVAFWAFTFGLATVLLRPALWKTKGHEAAAAVGEATSTSVQIARNAFIGLNALFAAFIALDAPFLLSGATPNGMTTQAYAHQGAFWLTVALLMLTAVIGWFFRGSLAHDTTAKLPRNLAFAWMGQGLVLGLATYRRIGIHIAHSGLSDLRIVGILGTTLVLSGVVFVALKLHRQKSFTWLLRRQLDAFAITAIVYFVTPTHAIAAQVNVSRVEHGEYTPLLHTFAQSHQAESAATFLPLLHHPDQRVREGVGALLADERSVLRRRMEDHDTWRAKDIATARTLAQLEAHNTDIDGALGNASPGSAKQVLLEITRVANEDHSLEEILSVQAAERSDVNSRGGYVQ